MPNRLRKDLNESAFQMVRRLVGTNAPTKLCEISCIMGRYGDSEERSNGDHDTGGTTGGAAKAATLGGVDLKSDLLSLAVSRLHT